MAKDERTPTAERGPTWKAVLPEGNVTLPNGTTMMVHDVGTEVMRRLYAAQGLTGHPVIAYQSLDDLRVIASIDDGLLHLSATRGRWLPTVTDLQQIIAAFLPPWTETYVVLPPLSTRDDPNVKVHVLQLREPLGFGGR